jgi:hypothetical protein
VHFWPQFWFLRLGPLLGSSLRVGVEVLALHAVISKAPCATAAATLVSVLSCMGLKFAVGFGVGVSGWRRVGIGCVRLGFWVLLRLWMGVGRGRGCLLGVD